MGDTVFDRHKGESMDLRFRCYAQEHGQRWHAICTDLNIAADGDSFREAKASLRTCIELYLEGVADLPAIEQHRFLRRRAPWHVRARLAFLARFHRPHPRRVSSQGFFLQSHIPTSV